VLDQSPYDHIADLYDTYVQTDLDLPFFLDEARRTPGRILELMAGTGRVTLPLVRAGADVTCVDNSPMMLAVLRDKLSRENLSADVREMDVRQLAFDQRFDLVLIPFHALAELPTIEDQQAALQAIHAHLADGGRFICALHNPPVRLKSVDGLLHLIGKHDLPDTQGRLLAWILQTQRHQQVEIAQFFEEYDRAGQMVTRRMIELHVNFVEKARFEAMIQAAGFAVEALYGDYARSPFDESTSPFMIWVLR
jgi:SAM-dependent methyltransferase